MKEYKAMEGSREWIEENLPCGVRLESIGNCKVIIAIELNKIKDSFPTVINKLEQMEIIGIEYEYIVE